MLYMLVRFTKILLELFVELFTHQSVQNYAAWVNSFSLRKLFSHRVPLAFTQTSYSAGLRFSPFYIVGRLHFSFIFCFMHMILIKALQKYFKVIVATHQQENR